MQKKVLPFSLKASGWLLSNLGRIFPALTARIFFRLYATPPKIRSRTPGLAVKGKAVAGIARLTKYDFDPGVLKIATYKWGDPGKRVLLMHGWGGTGPGFALLIDRLVQEGYQVISYDGPAHGASEGKRTNLVQWIHVLDQFLRQEGPFHAIIGHSVGALVAALTVARKDHGEPRLVLASPPLSAPSFFQDTFALFRIRPKVITHVYGLVRTKLKDDLHTMDLRHCLDRIGAGRVLLVYDGTDQLVKSTEVETFLTEYRPRSFRIEGEGHFRILKNPLVVDAIISFLGE
jgi:pimeloyl-ACP methyl ester carboxylesterase